MNDADQRFAEIQKSAEGKLRCECGNDDWHQFMFAGIPPAYVAGCKKCGRGYMQEGEVWVKKFGPAPRPEE